VELKGKWTVQAWILVLLTHANAGTMVVLWYFTLPWALYVMYLRSIDDAICVIVCTPRSPNAMETRSI